MLRKLLWPAIAGALLLAACSGSPAPAVVPAAAPQSSAPAGVSAQPVASAAPSASPSASPSLAASPSTAPSAQASAPAAPTAGVPVELQIPAIRVDAPIEQVGEDPDGAMSVPAKWDDVGWFKLGYRPGENGNSVIDGHLDSTTDRAVFWDLHLLKPGDNILVKDDDGKTLTFQIVETQAYPYNNAPLQNIFGSAGAPMLNLITCNGTWDAANKNYNQRLVVYSKLAS